MATTLLQFGSYALFGTFYPEKDDRSSRVSVVEIPRSDIGVALSPRRKTKTLTIKGGFVANQAGVSDIRTAVDNLMAALDSGPANLQLDTDRYWRNMSKENCVVSYDPSGYNDYVFVEITFTGPDPYQYSTTNSSDTWPGTGTRNITAGGSVYVNPTFTLNYPATGAVSDTITNTTTGDAFTINGTLTETQVIVNGGAQTVTYGDGTDAMFLFEGIFPRLFVGVNAMTLVGSAISSIVTSWTDRWS